MAEGGPLTTAHVMAETSGFAVGGDGMPTGHVDSVFAIGLMAGGMCVTQLDPNNEELTTFRDRETQDDFFHVFMFDRGDFESFVRDASELLAQT